MIFNIKISVVLITCTLIQSQGSYLPNFLNIELENGRNNLKNTIDHEGQSEIESAHSTENLVDGESLKTRHHSSIKGRKKQPPLLIKLMHDKITTDETSKLLVSTNHSGPLMRAWLPLEISREDATRTTMIHFHQTVSREKFGNFTDARIVLTLRDEIQLSETPGWWTLNILFPDKNTSSKSLNSRTKIYDFNITSYLHDSIAEKVDHPVPIVIDFQVVHDGTVLFLGDLFDVQVEQPYILLQYQELPESLFSSLMRRHEIHRRFSRSVQEATTEQAGNLAVQNSTANTTEPTIMNILNPPPLVVGNETILPSPSIEPPSKTCCRIHSLIVRPKELHWNNVITPESFDLGYCSGSCPFPMQSEYYNHTLHTILLDRYRLAKGFDIPSNLPHSTCVPTKYKDVSVLLEGEDDEWSYELRLYKTMLVAECGCR